MIDTDRVYSVELLSMASFWERLLCFSTYDYAVDISEQKVGQNRDLAGPPRHEARTAEAAPGRVERGEQGVARPGNSALSGGPQLELSRTWLQT